MGSKFTTPAFLNAVFSRNKRERKRGWGMLLLLSLALPAGVVHGQPAPTGQPTFPEYPKAPVLSFQPEIGDPRPESIGPPVLPPAFPLLPNTLPNKLPPPVPPQDGVKEEPSFQDVLPSPDRQLSPQSGTSGTPYQSPRDLPLGFAGLSRVASLETQDDNHFAPAEDRWRTGFPDWDRYGKGHPLVDDYPYVKGNWWDPYNQNILKGDYPILGQNIFLEVTATTEAIIEPRQIPAATTPFESSARPGNADFFGNPNQILYSQYFFLSLDLFHGDGAFRPVDWRIKLTPAFNVNYLSASELAVVSPDVGEGLTRARTFATLNEWFVETKLADLGPNYDFLSLRVGSQPFTSDFRGFIFSDTNRAVRLFGTLEDNRDQFNFIYFRMQEKDTNSGLNTFDDRKQDVFIANWYIQDFIFPGYTAEFSFHFDHDQASTLFDTNGFLVRPDPVGAFQPHTVDVAYLGWAGDGHINQFNISHAFYWAVGYDSLNPLANQAQNISAGFAAIELSYDQDWARFRTSFLWSSGDHNINNHQATGFDSIMDNPNFAGGEFSYWQREAIPLLGVNLTQRESLIPDLRSSKLQGQANFVNPGLILGNAGVDFDLTPKLRLINNANVLWFDNTNVLQQFLYQSHINRFIGIDRSSGVEYRPLLNNNIIFKMGVSTLIPGQGFKDIYDGLGYTQTALFASFFDAVFTY
jgi:hypothetical protein